MRDRYDDDDDTVIDQPPACYAGEILAACAIGVALIVAITACYGAWTDAIGPLGNLGLLVIAAILLFWVTPAVFRRR